MGKKLTTNWLRKIGVKEVLIPGILLAAALGWCSTLKVENPHGV